MPQIQLEIFEIKCTPYFASENTKVTSCEGKLRFSNRNLWAKVLTL